MLIIFGALKIELIPILKMIHICNIHRTGKTIMYEGSSDSGPVTIIQTGIGAENAKRAAKFFRTKYLTQQDSTTGQNESHGLLLSGLTPRLRPLKTRP